MFLSRLTLIFLIFINLQAFAKTEASRRERCITIDIAGFVESPDCKDILREQCDTQDGRFIQFQNQYRCVSRATVNSCTRNGQGFMNSKGDCVTELSLGTCVEIKYENYYLENQNKILAEAKKETWTSLPKIKITQRTYEKIEPADFDDWNTRVRTMVDSWNASPSIFQTIETYDRYKASWVSSKTYMTHVPEKDQTLNMDSGNLCNSPPTGSSQKQWIIELPLGHQIAISPSSSETKPYYVIEAMDASKTVVDKRGVCDRVEIIRGGDYLYCEQQGKSQGIVGISTTGRSAVRAANQQAMDQSARECADENFLERHIVQSKYSVENIKPPQTFRGVMGTRPGAQ